MADNAVISGEYVTFKHIKTRKMVVLEIEVAEERFQEVIEKLGMPIGGESKPVAVALLKTEQKEVGTNSSETKEQTEDEKLRTRAVMLCKDQIFHEYIGSITIPWFSASEDGAIEFICYKCSISSRSELATNIEAQNKFKELLEQYKTWQLQKQYVDNLNR